MYSNLAGLKFSGCIVNVSTSVVDTSRTSHLGCWRDVFLQARFQNCSFKPLLDLNPSELDGFVSALSFILHFISENFLVKGLSFPWTTPKYSLRNMPKRMTKVIPCACQRMSTATLKGEIQREKNQPHYLSQWLTTHQFKVKPMIQ